MSSDRWAPIEDGAGRYCAPACGRGCTLAEFGRAHAAGAALARQLGDGWTYHVYENLGWHYEARSACGRIKVSVSFTKPLLFTAFLGPRDCAGGTWVQTRSDAHEAVAAVLREAKAAVAHYVSQFEGL
jgi:hypothetical protein